MRFLCVLVLSLLPVTLWAQSRTVLPEELQLSIEVDATEHERFTREMVLITIRGVYRRHITREEVVQPDLEGFSWTQLGDDLWLDERINGEKVKTFRRRMALFPDRPGPVEIGAFRHKLTLTDESDEWFEHVITSEPTTIDVAAAPETEDWWLPVKALRVSDNWSNAPDQLKPGEGVLRIVRIEALGVTPEMIPPMPTLHSPSAMIFPHPEKRLVELTPQGPQSFAYWRWTIRPSNDTSTIVEPISFAYFDTFARVEREVTISAQRVAYGDVAPSETVPDAGSGDGPPVRSVRLPGGAVALVALTVFLGGLGYALQGYRLQRGVLFRRLRWLDPLVRALRHAARRGDGPALRRAATAMMRRDGVSAGQKDVLSRLDALLFARRDQGGPPVRIEPQVARDLVREFLAQSVSGHNPA
ncbi:MAG: hypothetical protein WBB25_18825 [Sulfitobacter sp.]|jgi:hypothetical protein